MSNNAQCMFLSMECIEKLRWNSPKGLQDPFLMKEQENLHFTVETIWNHVLLKSFHRIITCHSLNSVLAQMSDIDFFLDSKKSLFKDYKGIRESSLHGKE